MTTQFDPRLIRVGVEVKNELQWFEGLYIQATITKVANATANDATIKIVNIDKRLRDYILTETTPWNFNRVRKRVIVEAGRQSYGMGRIFTGDICEVTPSQPPDVSITIKAKTNAWDKGNIVTRNNPARMQLKTIAQGVASSMGLTLMFEADDKTISNYAFTGAASKQVEHLAELGRVNAYIDDTNLVIKNIGKSVQSYTNVLSMDSGMVGIPEATEQGIRVKYLYEPTSRIGSLLDVVSKMYPGVNGKYIIYKMTYDISNRDDPFYIVAEAYKQGRYLR